MTAEQPKGLKLTLLHAFAASVTEPIRQREESSGSSRPQRSLPLRERQEVQEVLSGELRND